MKQSPTMTHILALAQHMLVTLDGLDKRLDRLEADSQPVPVRAKRLADVLVFRRR